MYLLSLFINQDDVMTIQSNFPLFMMATHFMEHMNNADPKLLRSLHHKEVYVKSKKSNCMAA